jgi:serine/threonine protein kinase/formylglycine-generating enzyme required for sulfatase activity
MKPLMRVVDACEQFKEDWRAGHAARIETYLERVEPGERERLVSKLLAIEVELRMARGENPTPAEFELRYPNWGHAITVVFAQGQREPERSWTSRDVGLDEGNHRPPPTEKESVVAVNAWDLTVGAVRSVEAEVEAAAIEATPRQLGRYQVTKRLGTGGFGTVYLAWDDELSRQVAIKVPRRELLRSPQQVESFLSEARIAAGLRHPAIVAVYDVGRIGDHGVFVVFEYVEGRNLSEVIETERLTPSQVAALLIPIAEAAHYAHCAGLVHRDLKPSNILVDADGHPHISDFGLAIREDLQDLRTGEIAGTPHYMSPEQARGETHRLDGRTDVWALGVMLYRCLLGRQPFSGRDYTEVFDEILHRDPKPPRQINDRIPRELERICLRCLSRRMADRYETAGDLADDLKRWLVAEASTDAFSKTPQPSQFGAADVPIARFVPKGLRAFDVEDAQFFLTLVPGPRDRDGLPEAIRSWKRRIEERDPARTFSVGLLYGPSGSGKSSLVKAGLLPRLSHQVRAIYVEASPTETETSIRAALVREFPDLAVHGELAQVTAAIRGRGAGHRGSKVLLVVDQFEQWLQSHPDEPDGALVRALRHCDGVGLQALLLVRDDFWMATTRFLKALEVRLLEGVNSSPVELFDLQHARLVLAELGRALGRFPQGAIPPASEEGRFLEKAVQELASADGRIIPVRMILFAEMLRHRDWTTKTLRELGGMEGIGETFLEESFSARSAPMAHRVHQHAAEAVLRALLPDPKSNLRGRLRSVQVLREASGYTDRPADFDELIYILDKELRLVTAVDPLSLDGEVDGSCPPAGEPFYQLTHDYLVPSLRQWLSRKQRETRRGRAELQLATIAAFWCDRPEPRRLPSLLEWLKILRFTRPRTWSADERRMMKAATWRFLIRVVAAIALIGAVAYAAVSIRNRERAHNALETALRSDFAHLPRLLADLSDRSAFLRPTLERLEKDQASQSQDREVATILLFRDRPTPDRASFLLGRLLAAEPDEMRVLSDALALHPEHAGTETLRRLLFDDSVESRARLRAACALARLEPDVFNSPAAPAAALAEALLAEHPRALPRWIELLGTVSRVIAGPLLQICRDTARDATAHAAAAAALADVLERGQQPTMLADATVEALPEASQILLHELVGVGPTLQAVDALRQVLDERASNPDDETGKDAIASRQASAAIALAALGEPDSLWPLLRHQSDPRVRSLLIQRLAASTLTTRVLLDRLSRPGIDPVERQALLLAGAEMRQAALAAPVRAGLIARARRLYVEDPDPGVHSAAELLLRRWGEAEIMKRADSELLSSASSDAGRRWQLGPNGHTFAILPGPLQFRMGAPPEQPPLYGSPSLHFRKIDRSLLVATKEVTLEQFQRFNAQHHNDSRYGDDPQCAAIHVSWFSAAAYCNWLSEVAGIPKNEWCYPEVVGPGMTITSDSVNRAGYRLPTEAEWEYFCRAGTLTSRPFGESPHLLSRYAWTWLNSENRIHPAGELLPNELGLFDVLGNAWEWCQDGPPGHYSFPDTDFPAYPLGTKEAPAGDPVQDETIDKIDRAHETWRILRGGAYSYAPDRARSAFRDWEPSGDVREYLGLRVVKTLPPGAR